MFQVGDIVWGDIGSNAKLGSNPNITTKELGAYAEFAVALDTQLALAPTDTLPALELCGLEALDEVLEVEAQQEDAAARLLQRVRRRAWPLRQPQQVDRAPDEGAEVA